MNKKGYELVNFCEFDKYAVKSYCAIHNVDESLNLGDITKVDIESLPPHNLILRCQNQVYITGNCLNGKDPSKVDFSASHKARQLAKRFLEQYNLNWCEVQLSYAIGIAKPMAIYVDSNKGNIEVPQEIYDECTPKRIIEDLDLLNVDYEELAKFGHYID